MNIKSHFENIRERIIEELEKANTSIFIAVAWFTDKKLFDVLCQKASLGVKVELIAIKDDINTSSSIDFNELFVKGGKIWLVEDQRTMHNKFCIIDENVVINGSYNWTYNANNNHENIMIISNHYETVENYIDQFKEIKKTNFGTEKEAFKKLSLRLSAFKNVIILNDSNDIETQTKKIKELSLFVSIKQFNVLTDIFNLLFSNKQESAISLIDKLIYETNNHLTEDEVAENSYNTIFEAALNGSIIGVKLFLGEGEKINVIDNENNTLLHCAARFNHLELIKFLINKHAEVNRMNSLFEYPIDLLSNKYPFLIECFDLLLDNSAFIDADKKTLSRYCFHLYKSKGFDALKAFLTRFENIEDYTSKCYFLDDFIDYKDTKVKDYLISKGVNINQLDSNNEHLFEKIACYSNCYDFQSSIVEDINYLIEKGIDWKTYYKSYVFVSIILGDFDSVYPLEVLNYKGETPFEYLMKTHYIEGLSIYKTIKRFIINPDKLKYQILKVDDSGNHVLRFGFSSSLIYRMLDILNDKKNSKTKSDYNEYYEIIRNIFLSKMYSDHNHDLLAQLLQRKLIDLVKILISNGTNLDIGMKIDPCEYYFSKSLVDTIMKEIGYSDNEIFNARFSSTNSGPAIKTIRYKNNDIFNISDIKYNKIKYIPHISFLELVYRNKIKELYNLFISYGAVICDSDIENAKIEEINKKNFKIEKERIEKEIELAKLKIDSQERKIQLEIEKKNIEQQAIDNRLKQERLEYENSNFIKKVGINYARKKQNKK